MKNNWQTKRFEDCLEKVIYTNKIQSNGWEEKRLKEIGVTQTGTTPKTSDKENYGNFIPFVKPADVDISGNGEIRYSDEGLTAQGLKNGRKMSKGSILMVCIGATIGKVGFVDRDVSCNQQINSLTVNKGFYPKFFYYALSTQSFFKQVIKNAAQATLPIINKGKWENLSVHYPKSIPEQQRIVAILDEAFAAIATAKENAEKNLQNARELFESYLQSVFANPGDGWDEKTLDQISENLDSKRVPITKNKRKSGIYPYYGASGIVDYVDGYIFDEDLLLVSEDGANLLARSTPIAFSVSGKIWVNNHAHILRFKNMETQKFVEMFFASIKLDEYITGAAQPKLNQSALNSIVIPVPPLPEQHSIVAKLDALSLETKKLEAVYQQKLAGLDELKKSVLQKAFNGGLV